MKKNKKKHADDESRHRLIYVGIVENLGNSAQAPLPAETKVRRAVFQTQLFSIYCLEVKYDTKLT